MAKNTTEWFTNKTLKDSITTTFDDSSLAYNDSDTFYDGYDTSSNDFGNKNRTDWDKI